MIKMHLTIICDKRTKEDYALGVNAKRGWNERPYYLINKILRDSRFQPRHITLEELASTQLNGEIIAMLHLDQTIHSEETTKCINSHISKNIKILNEKITDIRKRHIDNLFASTGGLSLCIKKEDNYDGLVMVKSDLNAGDAAGKGYAVMRPADVNRDWANPAVVVQRFVSSKADKNIPFGRMDRYVIFMGEIVYCSFYSKSDVIKRDTSIWQYYRDIEKLDRDFNTNRLVCLNEKGVYYREMSQAEQSNEQTVMAFCRLLSLDFGSIDTITDSKGNFYILDVNKTPWERGIPEHFLNIFRSKLLGLKK